MDNVLYGALKATLMTGLNVLSKGFDNTGTTSIVDKMNALSALYPTEKVEFYLPSGSYLVDADFTQPSNITYIMAFGAKFVGDAGTETITLNGGFEKGLDTAFENVVVAGSPNVDVVYPEWFGDSNMTIIGKSKTVTAKMLGMIPDDSTTGVKSSNFDKLSFGVTSDKTVLIDDKYYLSGKTFSEVTEIENLVLLGISANAEFVFDSDTTDYLFKPKNDSVIDEIRIENIAWTDLDDNYGTNNATRVFYSPDTEQWYIKKFIFKGCKVNNAFALWQCSANQLDPNAVTFGFKDILITENDFRNMDYIQYGFNFADFPHEVMEVTHNKVKNFDNVLVYAGTSNDHPYVNNLKASMKKLIYTNNTIDNDDDFWSNAGTGGSYYTPILYEGMSATILNNETKGMKANDNLKFVYDGYFNCPEFFSANNTYKNIINTDPPLLAGVSLMKCKGGGGSRHITKNKYIIEEDWAISVTTAKGVGLSKVAHQIIDIQTNIDDLYIADNYLDMYYLSMIVGSDLPIANLTVEKNTIKAKYITGNLLHAFSLTDTCKKLICRNNNVKSDSVATTGVLGVGSYVEPRLGYIRSNADIPYVDISNNTLDINGISDTIIKGIALTTINELHLNNNKIILNNNTETSSDFNSILDTNRFLVDKLFMDNNKIIYKYNSNSHLYCYGMRTPFKEPNFNYNVNGRVGIFSFLMGLSGEYVTTKEFYIRIKYKVQTNVSYDEFYANIKYYYDGVEGRNAIDFIDTSDVSQTVHLLKYSDVGGAYTDGEDLRIKLNAITPSALPAHYLEIINTASATADANFLKIIQSIANNTATTTANVQVDVSTVIVE